MHRLPIETKMEIFAKVYAKNMDVNVFIGSKFCTDGNNIWIPPIRDQDDEWIRLDVEMGVYHETGHVATKDVKKMPHKDKTRHSIANAVRDVCVEKYMEDKYPGIKRKFMDFLPQYAEKNTNPAMFNDSFTVFKKLMWALYYRGREVQLGIDTGLRLPDELEEIFQDRLDQFVKEVAEHNTVKESLDLTERIFEALNMDEEEQNKQKQEEQKKNQKNDPGKNNDQSGQNSPSQDPGDDDDSEPQEPGDQDDEPQDPSDKSDDDDNNDDDDNGKSKSNKSDEDGDEDDSTSASTNKGNEDEDEPAEPLSEEAKEKLKQLQEEMENGAEHGGIGEDIANEINEYADTTVLYREKNGLKENISFIPETYNWRTEVSNYEKEGRRMTGYLGRKMKNLFISERAPRWTKNLRSGRLDTNKLTKLLNHGSLDVCKRRTEHIFEDSAVYLIGDNSGSMRHRSNKYLIAQSILTSVASDLDKLRIPFEAIGFTTRSNEHSSTASLGIRSVPIDINIIKLFDEPYRRVKYRFIWPHVNNYTAELPAIKYAVRRLLERRETKKVLFVFSDGETCTMNSTLDAAMHEATIEYIKRVKRAGIKVVLVGIEASYMLSYCPDAIIVNDLDKFAAQFYGRLMKILL